MSQLPLAPPPQSGKDPAQDRWMYLLWKRISATGQILWSQIGFTGSNITDIATRNHADLQNLNTTNYTHLTSTQASELTGGGVTSLHSHSGGGSATSNVIDAATTIDADTSYIVLSYLTVNEALTVNGNLGVI